MRATLSLLLGGLALWATPSLLAQSDGLKVPQRIEAGSAFSIQSSGNGKGTLYIVGPGQMIKRDVQLGETTWFPAGSLYNAGHYTVVAASDTSSQTGSIDVVPGKEAGGPYVYRKAFAASGGVAWRHHRDSIRLR